MGDGSHPRRFILPSLGLASFAYSPPEILTSLFLIEIGLTFGCSVGVMGQIRTASSIVAVIFALLMGVLSVRFKHKSLLLTGLFFISISALGCGFASSYAIMLFVYSLTGLGKAMIGSMANALVGEHFTMEKRSSAVAWLMAGTTVSWIIGSPLTGLIIDFGGWQLSFLGYVLPVALLSFLVVTVALPSTSGSHQSTMNYLEGFKGVFSNRSAIACFVATALSMAAFQITTSFAMSFLRQRFLISIGWMSIIIIFTALCYILGSQVSGRFANKLGRKPLAVVGVFLVGVFSFSYINTINLWLSLAFFFITCLFGGLRYAASNSLSLEQVPRFRGTMMSINTAAINMGSALGAGIGGLTIILYGWGFLGITSGAFSIAAIIIYYLLTIDPTRSPK